MALPGPIKRLWQRQLRLSDAFWFSVAALACLTVVLVHGYMPSIATPSMLIAILILGGLVLGVRALVYVVVVVQLSLLLMAIQGGVVVGQILAVLFSSVLVLWWVRFRAQLGLRGTSADLLLFDLRDQLIAHGRIPSLQRDWVVDAEIRPARESSFSGDFVVAYLNDEGSRLDLVLVDVSGKGPDAAARALTLQGAMGGLLGATSFGEFFPAANQFLLRQDWHDGFATAVHLRIDLATGRFRLALAGHPPVARFSAGSSTWCTMGESGPLLGVSADATFGVISEELGVGDALVLYTDGVIEVPGRDLAFGIDKLLGEAERLVARSWKAGAKSLIDSVAESHNDDRAIVLVRRLPRHSASV